MSFPEPPHRDPRLSRRSVGERPLLAGAVLVLMIAATLFGFPLLIGGIAAIKGWSMVLPCIALYVLGTLYAQSERDLRFGGRKGGMALLLVAAAVLWMANLRGLYWSAFARGHGFFTANRVTANALFAIAAVTPEFISRRRRSVAGKSRSK